LHAANGEQELRQAEWTLYRLTGILIKYSMVKRWKGNYQYDSKQSQELIGHPRTFFTIEMEIFEDDTLKGIVQDDLESGGMTGIGEISGEVFKEAIYFEKQMPTTSILDLKKGRQVSLNEKHPLIIYVGKLEEENKYCGTWSFEKKWAFFLGFIPIKYCPGKGIWEMELENE
jgi:hypothetical protein